MLGKEEKKRDGWSGSNSSHLYLTVFGPKKERKKLSRSNKKLEREDLTRHGRLGIRVGSGSVRIIRVSVLSVLRSRIRSSIF